jgi:hypothetical protein
MASKPDLAILLGAPKAKSAPMGQEPNQDDAPSAEYMQAYKEYETNPSAETFWAAVKACAAGY